MDSSHPSPNPGILGIAPYIGGKSVTPSGVKAVKLSSNETPLGPSPEAIRAFTDMSGALHRYPDGSSQVLRQAIADIHGLPVDQLVCGCGSDELIGLLIRAYAAPNEEVLYSEHGFLMYKIYAQAASAAPVTAPEKGLRTDVDAMLARVTERTKIVFLANPNNPTGSYITRNDLHRLHAGLPSQVILAIDGAYTEYATHVPDYVCGRELVESAQNVVMLRTFSKIYGLAALRVGWAYGPSTIIDVLNRTRGPFNVAAPAIAAAAAAMRDTAFTDEAQQFNARWLQWLSASLTQLGLAVYPSIANFILVQFPGGRHSAAAANRFLMERGLIVRDVVSYGLPECLRISIGLEADNHAVVEALGEFLK